MDANNREMNVDEYYLDNPHNDTRFFPCTCQGPTISARIRVTMALMEMYSINPLPLPTTRPQLPMMLRHFTEGCNCTKDYFSMTNQLLKAIKERNEEPCDSEQFVVRNQHVRNLFYYFSGEFLS